MTISRMELSIPARVITRTMKVTAVWDSGVPLLVGLNSWFEVVPKASSRTSAQNGAGRAERADWCGRRRSCRGSGAAGSRTRRGQSRCGLGRGRAAPHGGSRGRQRGERSGDELGVLAARPEALIRGRIRGRLQILEDVDEVGASEVAEGGVGWAVEGDPAPRGEHQHPVAEAEALHRVGHHDDRPAALGQIAQQGHHPSLQPRVEPRGRLVEEQRGGLGEAAPRRC